MVTYNGVEHVASYPSLLTTRVDVASGTATYYGYAEPGTLDAGSAWLITRLSTSGSATALKFAGGTTSFDKTWNARVSLTYV